MKKIALLTIAGMFIMVAAISQPKSPDESTSKEIRKESKRKGREVSNVSIEAFSFDFPKSTDVHWRRSEDFDEATFTSKDGMILTAYYDTDGKLVGTTHFAKFSDLPEKGQQEIKKHYKDYTIGQVVFFDDNEANESDMVLWESQFDDEDNYFVELSNGGKISLVKVDNNGAVSFFKELK
jgi:hypothetical protein